MIGLLWGSGFRNKGSFVLKLVVGEGLGWVTTFSDTS